MQDTVVIFWTIYNISLKYGQKRKKTQGSGKLPSRLSGLKL